MEFAPFYVGQRVICLKAYVNPRTSQQVLIKDNVYIVQDIKKLCKCHEWHVNINVNNPGEALLCGTCNEVIRSNTWWAQSDFFAPINEAHEFQAISYSKVMEKESRLISVN